MQYLNFVLMIRSFLLAVITASAVIHIPSASAQQPSGRSADVLLEEVVVTARKREETAQEVPVAVTAYGAEQIEALKVRDLTSLAVGIPNVALDDIGTIKGVANFSIRGLGVNSSIPSIDPTVGVFVDGVYIGTNLGLIFDTFDLESIEVLRGPQGTLFGRNVTGGAILINSKKPSHEPESSIKYAADGGGDGGLNHYLMATTSGSVSDTVAAKVTAYYNNDEGWFENQFNGEDFGELRQVMIRPSLLWNPTETSELYLKYENNNINGDGPAAQSHPNRPGFSTNSAGVTDPIPASDGGGFSRNSHDFSIDEEGFVDAETDLLSAKLDWEASGGTFTNIFGWRDLEQYALSDIDAQPINRFHAPIDLIAKQFSNEVRYNGLLMDGRLNFTAGLYYFTQDIDYAERRILFTDLPPLGTLAGAVPAFGNFPTETNQYILDGGGEYEVETTALFLAGDYDLNDTYTLNLGIRYTVEEKDVKIASLIDNRTFLDNQGSAIIGETPAILRGAMTADNRCNVVDGTCPFDFDEDDDWNTWSPKVGITRHLNDGGLVYAHWARGYRSGGYNLRNTSATLPIEGFDEERTDNFEIGYKADYDRGRFNASIFYNRIEDMQRELNTASDGAGVVQRVVNTADARIVGIELEGIYKVTDSFLLNASVGALDAEYTEVKEDLNGDGLVNGTDEDLDLPRAADLTWSLGFNWDVDIGGWGYMTARANYAHRDESAYTDNNRGFINEQDIVNAGLDFHGNNGWTLSVYGNNLLNEVKHGGDTQLPDTVGGGTFSPLAKGRHFGIEIQYDF